jgi:hypothetical protein
VMGLADEHNMGRSDDGLAELPAPARPRALDRLRKHPR